MRTLTPKLGQSPRREPPSSLMPHSPANWARFAIDSVLPAQGAHTTLSARRFPAANPEGAISASGTKARNRFGHKFARMPVYPNVPGAIPKKQGAATFGWKLPLRRDILRSPGKPLDRATCAFMEHRFGHDFGRVRVHADARADAAASALGARAFTIGADIVFRRKEFAPQTPSGTRLLAHELAHVVQQNGSRSGSSNFASEAAERSADRAANDALAGRAVARPISTPVCIARQVQAGSSASGPSLKEQADTLRELFSHLLVEADRDG